MILKVRDLIIGAILKIGNIDIEGTANGNLVIDGERTVITAVDSSAIYGKVLYLDSNMELQKFTDNSGITIYIDEQNGRNDNTGDENSPLDSLDTLADRVGSLSFFRNITVILVTDCLMTKDIVFSNYLSVELKGLNAKRDISLTADGNGDIPSFYIEGDSFLTLDSIAIITNETLTIPMSAIVGSPREIALVNSDVTTMANLHFIETYHSLTITAIGSSFVNSASEIVHNPSGSTVCVTLDATSSILDAANTGTTMKSNSAGTMTNINVLS